VANNESNDPREPRMWPNPQPALHHPAEGDDLPIHSPPFDLPPETLGTYLPQYLHDATSGDGPNVAAPNQYPISATSQISSPSVDGRPAPITTGPIPGLGQKSFMDAPNGDIDAEEWKNTTDTLSGYSNSGDLDDADIAIERLAAILDKNSQSDGHRLLAGIKGSEPNTSGKALKDLPPPSDTASGKIQQKISAVLTTNRFNPTGATPYIDAGKFSSPTLRVQRKFGEYVAQTDTEDTSMKRLFQVGLSMIFKATGHGYSNNDPRKSGLEAIKPSWVQLGTSKVPVSKMRAKFAAGSPRPARPGLTDSDLLVEPEFDSDQSRENRSIEERESYGQLTSPLETFAGFAPFGMVALCLASMLILIGLALVAAIIIWGIATVIPGGSTTTLGKANINPADMTLGSWGGVAWILAAMDIPGTNHPLEECLVAGILAFYSVPTDGLFGRPTSIAGLALAAAAAFLDIDFLTNILTSSGFYAGILRNAVRDPLNVESIAEGFPSSLPAQGVLHALGEMVRSPLWQFLMTMIQIGNVSIDQMTGRFGTNVGINDIEDNYATKIAKSRVNPLDATGGSQQLVWRHANNQSAYLYPAGAMRAMAQLTDRGVRNFDTGVYEKKFYKAKEGGNPNRFSSDQVMTLEDRLEAEYVPFYFQDLRTNEIISFNAFITNLSDRYSPDYNTTDAYGRIDPVMTYSKTTRSIGLTFILAATSEEDFDAMWWDINKLTTMLYPQWSKGRPVQTADEKKFIMPFSQIPTASPMIRMRVGDVVRGNYSKFNLGRLFGASIEGGPESDYNIGFAEKATFSFGEVSGGTLAEAHAAWRATTVNIRDRMLKENPASTVKLISIPGTSPSPEFGYAKDQQAILKAGHVVVGEEEPDLMGGIGGTPPTVTLNTTTANSVKILKVFTENKYQVEFVDPELNKLWNEEASQQKKYVWYVAHSDLSPDMKWIETELAPMPESVIDALTEIDDFYSGNSESPGGGNAIVRSFESAMGRGLAGFIDGFTLDYGESTWETSIGSRAPKMVTINIGFKPIHDIPPGLDSDGFNRAPLYNVGGIVNSIAGDQWGQDVADPNSPVRTAYDKQTSKITRSKGIKKEKEIF